MMSFLFWFFSVTIFYVYLGYPLALWLVSLVVKKKVDKGPLEPSVTVLLAAFNEEKNIEKRLINLLNIDYPEEKIEILVGSDGASDQTDEIVSKFRSPRIRFFRYVVNRGKPSVINALMKEAKGDVIVFADARQDFERDAIRHLVENFHDPKVGCASGELFFEKGAAQAIGKGMGIYWFYEKFLRRKEAEVASMLGATGAIYAIRRHLFSEIPADMLVDDMYVPLSIINQGYRAVFESRAHAFDRVSKRGQEEFKRKVRTLAGNYQIFRQFGNLFDLRKSPIAIQLFSHKFLRLLVPFFLVGILMSNLFLLHQPFFRFTLILQIFFYGMAMIEALNERVEHESRGGIHRKIGYMAYTFCLLNYSALMALVYFLRKKEKGIWEKAYAE